MIKIVLPKGYRNEREYTCRVLFEEILDEQIGFDTHDVSEYHIVIANNKTIRFSDNFFSVHKENYLRAENIPHNFISVKNKFVPLENLPVLFGEDAIEINKSYIFANHDIIASAFFFLSRWEEYALQKTDKFGRFDENHSFSVKHKIITRALVNEYTEYIQNIANELDYSISKKTKYSFLATHDLDYIIKWPSTKYFLKTLSGDIFKRRSLRSFFRNIKLRFSDIDPYDEYDFILKLSSEYGIHSRFYFLMSPFNRSILKTPFGVNLFEKIKQHDFSIGLHPDMDTFDNPDKLSGEKKALEQFAGNSIIDSRQHYLQLQLPELWNTLEKCGIKTDSSLYYNSYPGFRTGTCTPHSVFNFLESRHIRVIEYPLIFMEQTFVKFSNPEDVFEMCRKLNETTKRFNGTFTILWHNSNFNDEGWSALREYYRRLIGLK